MLMRVLFLLTLYGMLFACGGSPADPEAEIRAWIDRMEQAAEVKDRHAMLDGISENYTDARGNTRKEIGDRLLVVFLRQQPIAIVSSIDELVINGGTAATVDLDVVMAGKTSGTFGLSADSYHFELELEKPGDDWLLIGARWAESGQDPH